MKEQKGCPWPFCSTASEKRGFRFPYKSITCDASHWFARPSMGAMMTSCEAITYNPPLLYESPGNYWR